MLRINYLPWTQTRTNSAYLDKIPYFQTGTNSATPTHPTQSVASCSRIFHGGGLNTKIKYEHTRAQHRLIILLLFRHSICSNCKTLKCEMEKKSILKSHKYFQINLICRFIFFPLPKICPDWNRISLFIVFKILEISKQMRTSVSLAPPKNPIWVQGQWTEILHVTFAPPSPNIPPKIMYQYIIIW